LLAPAEPSELLDRAWGLIANAGWDASTGRVDLEKSPGWHDAAVRWRDDYHAALRVTGPPRPDDRDEVDPHGTAHTG
jgi:hypothetical protein